MTIEPASWCMSPVRGPSNTFGFRMISRLPPGASTRLGLLPTSAGGFSLASERAGHQRLEPRPEALSEVSTGIVPRLLAILALVALSLSGCNRHREPSPEFSLASESFNKLYAQKLDDAYLDPKM